MAWSCFISLLCCGEYKWSDARAGCGLRVFTECLCVFCEIHHRTFWRHERLYVTMLLSVWEADREHKKTLHVQPHRHEQTQPSRQNKNVGVTKVVCWSKHVCNAAILPSNWRYIEQKQVMGLQSGWHRDTIHPITRHCTINMMLF